jgi:hypothetical protein
MYDGALIDGGHYESAIALPCIAALTERVVISSTAEEQISSFTL